MHAPQSVHRQSTTAGRLGARINARVGQVARQAPHAVQEDAISTLTVPPPGAMPDAIRPRQASRLQWCSRAA